jgi:hypothetical protein
VGKRGITQCAQHSFRLSGARIMYGNGVRIENICDVLNHHSIGITRVDINIASAGIEASKRG